jgi:uncharacterized protein
LKVKLFTHTDLDGIGCAIVAKHAFHNVDVEYCNYDEIDKKVEEFTATMQYRHYDKVFITDISVSEKVALLIDYSMSRELEAKNKYVLIDHHATAKWLNKYDWAVVDDQEISIYPKEIYMKSSGTSMLYGYLWDKHEVNLPFLLQFIELVRRYDTWEWYTKHNDQHAKRLNDLFFILGREKFIERMMRHTNPVFTDSEKLLLELEESKINRYIEMKEKEMVVKPLGSVVVAGIVFAEQYHSQLGNHLATKHPEADFIVMINMGDRKVSYRGVKEGFHLGEMAKYRYGGGGHAKAAGSQIKLGLIDEVLNTLLEIN